MRRWTVITGLVAMIGSLSAAAGRTGEVVKPSTSVGKAHFRTYCASCHGREGRGDGPLARSLRFRPADLTVIARHNEGQFPADHVRAVIDGRKRVDGHGPGDMPAWGDAFKNSVEGYSEEHVVEKIDQLTAYIEAIQEPSP